MSFDLYLDESGSFESAGEHTLIGGVIIPHSSNPSLKQMLSWETDIRSRISQSGIFDTEALNMGDEWHSFLRKSDPLKRRLNPDEEDRLKKFNSKKHYTFNHCSENFFIRKNEKVSVPGRWEAQGWVLKEYLKKVQKLGGFPVVFDNPNGIYHIDSNTTYMAIFASGIVQLYHNLMQRFPGQEIVLYIHTAARLNVTKKSEPEKYRISPTAGKEANLERSLYLNHIKNFVFLNGGSDLLDLKGFQESINSFDILLDFEANDKKTPNPATVICDYVCNCFFTDNENRNYRATFKNSDLLVIQAFGKAPDLSDAAIQRLAEQHDWFSFLKILISRSFPQKETKEFFVRMKSDQTYNQITCVNSLVDYLYPFVNGREDMDTMEERLKLIIDKCDEFDNNAYLFLKANLLIYIHTLQTHMGKDVSDAKKEFVSCIKGIHDIEQRDSLLTLYCNRQIVTETDCFEFAKGEDWFEAIKIFLEKSIANSNELLSWFSMLSDDEMTGCRSLQYGKILGSYVQLLTKEIRQLTGEQRENKQEAAIAASNLALEHLAGKSELSRAHQNACDLYSEISQFDLAMDHLYNSLFNTKCSDFYNQAEKVLTVTGHYGEKNMFAYLHYVSMMHRCFRTGNQYGEKMLALILKDSINIEKVNHLISDPHPQAVILWHLASSLAYQAGHGKMAEQLFSYSIDALTNCGDLFWTIRMAVNAEMIGLGLMGKLKSSPAEWKEKGQQYLDRLYSEYSEKVPHNPFSAIIHTISINDPLTLFHAADCVVY